MAVFSLVPKSANCQINVEVFLSSCQRNQLRLNSQTFCQKCVRDWTVLQTLTRKFRQIVFPHAWIFLLHQKNLTHTFLRENKQVRLAIWSLLFKILRQINFFFNFSSVSLSCFKVCKRLSTFCLPNAQHLWAQFQKCSEISRNL